MRRFWLCLRHKKNSSHADPHHEGSLKKHSKSAVNLTAISSSDERDDGGEYGGGRQERTPSFPSLALSSASSEKEKKRSGREVALKNGNSVRQRSKSHGAVDNMDQTSRSVVHSNGLMQTPDRHVSGPRRYFGFGNKRSSAVNASDNKTLSDDEEGEEYSDTKDHNNRKREDSGARVQATRSEDQQVAAAGVSGKHHLFRKKNNRNSNSSSAAAGSSVTRTSNSDPANGKTVDRNGEKKGNQSQHQEWPVKRELQTSAFSSDPEDDSNVFLEKEDQEYPSLPSSGKGEQVAHGVRKRGTSDRRHDCSISRHEGKGDAVVVSKASLTSDLLRRSLSHLPDRDSRFPLPLHDEEHGSTRRSSPHRLPNPSPDSGTGSSSGGNNNNANNNNNNNSSSGGGGNKNNVRMSRSRKSAAPAPPVVHRQLSSSSSSRVPASSSLITASSPSDRGAKNNNNNGLTSGTKLSSCTFRQAESACPRYVSAARAGKRTQSFNSNSSSHYSHRHDVDDDVEDGNCCHRPDARNHNDQNSGYRNSAKNKGDRRNNCKHNDNEGDVHVAHDFDSLPPPKEQQRKVGDDIRDSHLVTASAGKVDHSASPGVESEEQSSVSHVRGEGRQRTHRTSFSRRKSESLPGDSGQSSHEDIDEDDDDLTFTPVDQTVIRDNGCRFRSPSGMHKSNGPFPDEDGISGERGGDSGHYHRNLRSSAGDGEQERRRTRATERGVKSSSTTDSVRRQLSGNSQRSTAPSTFLTETTTSFSLRKGCTAAASGEDEREESDDMIRETVRAGKEVAERGSRSERNDDDNDCGNDDPPVATTAGLRTSQKGEGTESRHTRATVLVASSSSPSSSSFSPSPPLKAESVSDATASPLTRTSCKSANDLALSRNQSFAPSSQHKHQHQQNSDPVSSQVAVRRSDSNFSSLSSARPHTMLTAVASFRPKKRPAPLPPSIPACRSVSTGHLVVRNESCTPAAGSTAAGHYMRRGHRHEEVDGDDDDDDDEDAGDARAMSSKVIGGKGNQRTVSARKAASSHAAIIRKSAPSHDQDDQENHYTDDVRVNDEEIMFSTGDFRDAGEGEDEFRDGVYDDDEAIAAALQSTSSSASLSYRSLPSLIHMTSDAQQKGTARDRNLHSSVTSQKGTTRPADDYSLSNTSAILSSNSRRNSTIISCNNDNDHVKRMSDRDCRPVQRDQHEHHLPDITNGNNRRSMSSDFKQIISRSGNKSQQQVSTTASRQVSQRSKRKAPLPPPQTSVTASSHMTLASRSADQTLHERQLAFEEGEESSGDGRHGPSRESPAVRGHEDHSRSNSSMSIDSLSPDRSHTAHRTGGESDRCAFPSNNHDRQHDQRDALKSDTEPLSADERGRRVWRTVPEDEQKQRKVAQSSAEASATGKTTSAGIVVHKAVNGKLSKEDTAGKKLTRIAINGSSNESPAVTTDVTMKRYAKEEAFVGTPLAANEWDERAVAVASVRRETVDSGTGCQPDSEKDPLYEQLSKITASKSSGSRPPDENLPDDHRHHHNRVKEAETTARRGSTQTMSTEPETKREETIFRAKLLPVSMDPEDDHDDEDADGKEDHKWDQKEASAETASESGDCAIADAQRRLIANDDQGNGLQISSQSPDCHDRDLRDDDDHDDDREAAALFPPGIALCSLSLSGNEDRLTDQDFQPQSHSLHPCVSDQHHSHRPLPPPLQHHHHPSANQHNNNRDPKVPAESGSVREQKTVHQEKITLNQEMEKGGVERMLIEERVAANEDRTPDDGTASSRRTLLTSSSLSSVESTNDPGLRYSMNQGSDSLVDGDAAVAGGRQTIAVNGKPQMTDNGQANAQVKCKSGSSECTKAALLGHQVSSRGSGGGSTRPQNGSLKETVTTTTAATAGTKSTSGGLKSEVIRSDSSSSSCRQSPSSPPPHHRHHPSLQSLSSCSLNRTTSIVNIVPVSESSPASGGVTGDDEDDGAKSGSRDESQKVVHQSEQQLLLNQQSSVATRGRHGEQEHALIAISSPASADVSNGAGNGAPVVPDIETRASASPRRVLPNFSISSYIDSRLSRSSSTSASSPPAAVASVNRMVSSAADKSVKTLSVKSSGESNSDPKTQRSEPSTQPETSRVSVKSQGPSSSALLLEKKSATLQPICVSADIRTVNTKSMSLQRSFMPSLSVPATATTSKGVSSGCGSPAVKFGSLKRDTDLNLMREEEFRSNRDKVDQMLKLQKKSHSKILTTREQILDQSKQRRHVSLLHINSLPAGADFPSVANSECSNRSSSGISLSGSSHTPSPTDMKYESRDDRRNSADDDTTTTTSSMAQLQDKTIISRTVTSSPVLSPSPPSSTSAQDDADDDDMEHQLDSDTFLSLDHFVPYDRSQVTPAATTAVTNRFPVHSKQHQQQSVTQIQKKATGTLVHKNVSSSSLIKSSDLNIMAPKVGSTTTAAGALFPGSMMRRTGSSVRRPCGPPAGQTKERIRQQDPSLAPPPPPPPPPPAPLALLTVTDKSVHDDGNDSGVGGSTPESTVRNKLLHEIRSFPLNKKRQSGRTMQSLTAFL